jgi:hypothetical protein
VLGTATFEAGAAKFQRLTALLGSRGMTSPFDP